jgi:hypothetical protein
MVVDHGQRTARATDRLQRRKTASHCWACGGVSGSRCTHGRGATRVRASTRGKNKSQRATTAVRRRCSKIVEPLWTEFYECMHGHAETSVTGLQLMSAAVHLDAAWSPGLGREARREENAASRSQKESTVTAPAA